MPPAPFCLPGPHDVHNAGSVKLAEATRIRLILPGLNTTPAKEPQGAGSGKQTGRAAGPDAAAASAKAQKKLQKLQGIASQAEQEHAGIIVDGEVLQEDCLNNSSPPSCDSNGKSNSSNKLSPTQIGLDRRKGLTAAADANTQGSSSQDASARGSRAWPRSLTCRAGSSSRLLGASEGVCQGSRLVATGGTDGNSSPASASSSTSSSRRGSGDKPHVPIWERSLPNAPVESKRAAAGPKVLQAVALKTFAPTLGSLGAMLTQETGPVHAQDGSGLASSSRPAAVLRSRSAAKASGGSSTSAAALRKHPTPPYGRLSAAAAASASAGQTPAAALAAAAAPLGVELPSALHHVAFSSGASVYTPSQLLEKLILR